jgi:hypothetical protein
MVPRAYLFSKAEKLINWRSVREHARDAESRGTPVFVELFEKSSHCAHIQAEEDAKRYWSTVQKGWDTRVNGVGELVEDEAGQGEKDGFEVKVEEVDVNFRRWDCGGHGVPVRTADAEVSTLINWICACGGVVPLKGIGKRKCLSVNFCFAQVTAGADFASDNYDFSSGVCRGYHFSRSGPVMMMPDGSGTQFFRMEWMLYLV